MPQKFIQNAFLAILSEIEKRPVGNPKITLRRIVGEPSNQNRHITEREATYCWPGKNRDEGWRFGIIETLGFSKLQGVCI